MTKQFCLDHFVVVGESHSNYVVREFLQYCHKERPHQGLGNVSITGPPLERAVGQCDVVCRKMLGGLLKHYERRAA